MKKVKLDNNLEKQFKCDTTLNLFGMAQSPTASVFVEGDNMAVVDGDQCGFYGSNTQFVDSIIEMMPESFEVCATATSLVEYIAEKHGHVDWKTDCGLFVYNGKPIEHQPTYHTQEMSADYWQMVSEGTPYKASRDEIVPNLQNKPSSAIYVDGRPVCWAMLHTTGSLGMLYTLPEFRCRGMALDVSVDLCRKVIAQGNKPFAYIVKGNTASEQLSQKYNMEYVGDYSWVGITKENK